MATSTGWTFGNTSRNSYALNAASFICDSWVRSVGATGWYNETYGGGWYMTDTTWVQSYNGKPIYVENGVNAGCNGFNVCAHLRGTSHSSIEVSGGNYTMGLGCHSNGSWYWWRGTANPLSSANKSYVMEYNGAIWKFTGAIYSTTGIYTDGYMTAKIASTSSDARLKRLLGRPSLTLGQIAAAPWVRFAWLDGSGAGVGSLAQWWQPVLPEVVTRDKKGFFGLQYGVLAYGMAKVVADETIQLKRRVEALERENKRLETEIAKLLTC